MPYQVLALKWRPQVFEDIVGQEPVTMTLRNAIQQGRIAHAFLFSGVRGVGKTTTARILAKALNCASGPTVRPCGACPACSEIARGRALDVLEIDGATNNSVEQVREIVEASQYAPSRDRFKIYIIDEVHMLSTSAFNALLKTLEEPPPRVKFIFATTEYHKIPETILSRCQQFEFRTVPSEKITAQLQRIAEEEGIRIAGEALSHIARAAEGSLRDGLSALDQVIAAVGTDIEEKHVTEILGLIERDVLRSAARAIVERDTEAILRIIADLVQGGRDLRAFSRDLMQYFRDVLVVQAAPDAPELVVMGGEREDLREIAGEVSEDDLVRFLDVLTNAEASLRWSPEPRYHLEVTLLKMSQLGRLASFEELIARLEALESGRPSTPDGSAGGSKAKLPRSAPERAPASKSEAVAGSRVGSGGEDPAAVLLERVRSVKVPLYTLLSEQGRVSFEGDRLRIGFPEDREVIRAQVEQGPWRDLLEQIASEVAGRPMELEVSVAPAAPLGTEEPAPPGEPEPHPAPEAGGNGPNGVRDRALQHPLVRRFVETLQAEVDEVRELGASSPPASRGERS